MITSSNFFNKNLFVPDDEESISDKLEDGQWMPIKLDKPYGTIDMVKQISLQERSLRIQGKNQGLPYIRKIDKKNKEINQIEVTAGQQNLTHRTSFTNYHSLNRKPSKRLKQVKFQFNPFQTDRYFQNLNITHQGQQYKPNSLATFLNTRRFQHLQKYSIDSLNESKASQTPKHLPKGTKISNNKNISEQLKNLKFPKSRQHQSIDFKQLKTHINFSPLAKQLNFILKKKKNENSDIFKLKKRKQKIEESQDPRNFQHIARFGFNVDRKPVTDIKI